MPRRRREPDLSNFGGRIIARARKLECPYCGAKPGEECMTMRANGYGTHQPLPTSLHVGRWSNAKAELIAEGDGPGPFRLRSVP